MRCRRIGLLTRTGQSHPRSRSPLFHVGAQIHFKRPRRARLFVDMPIILRNVVRIENAVDRLQCVPFGKEPLDEFGVDRSINHYVRDVDPLRA
jgi:hypothetical protein